MEIGGEVESGLAGCAPGLEVGNAAGLPGLAFPNFGQVEIPGAGCAYFPGVFSVAGSEQLDETFLADQALLLVGDQAVGNPA